eukprot:Colp12_sorted_trinity150504_noHs@36568
MGKKRKPTGGTPNRGKNTVINRGSSRGGSRGRGRGRGFGQFSRDINHRFQGGYTQRGNPRYRGRDRNVDEYGRVIVRPNRYAVRHIFESDISDDGEPTRDSAEDETDEEILPEAFEWDPADEVDTLFDEYEHRRIFGDDSVTGEEPKDTSYEDRDLAEESQEVSSGWGSGTVWGSGVMYRQETTINSSETTRISSETKEEQETERREVHETGLFFMDRKGDSKLLATETVQTATSELEAM